VPQPPTKLARIKAALDRGDEREAIRIAARFPQLGDAREAVTRAWAAYTRPAFYRELGQDPAAHIRAGVAALRRRYGWS
jgi:hypothetical protein